MPRTYLAEVEGVSAEGLISLKVKARVDLLRQVLHEEVHKEGVRVCVKHSDPLTKSVFQKRIECVLITIIRINCNKGIYGIYYSTKYASKMRSNITFQSYILQS